MIESISVREVQSLQHKLRESAEKIHRLESERAQIDARLASALYQLARRHNATGASNTVPEFVDRCNFVALALGTDLTGGFDEAAPGC